MNNDEAGAVGSEVSTMVVEQVKRENLVDCDIFDDILKKLGPDKNVAIEVITPARASVFLENRVAGQRKLQKAAVAYLVREMKNGTWRLTGDAICFVKEKLANGQHRMSALVKSGLSFPFLVFRTDDESVYDSLDCGRKRSIADVLQQHSIESAKRVACAARIVLNCDHKTVYPTKIGTAGDCADVPTRSDFIAFARENAVQLVRLSKLVDGIWAESHLLASSLALGFLFMAARRPSDEPAALAYLREASCGGVETGSPAAMLHKRLLRGVNSKAKLPAGYVLALMIKGWRLHRYGGTCKVLKLKLHEEFPKMP